MRKDWSYNPRAETGIASHSEQWVLEGYMQAVVSWVHANDLESLEEAQAALAYFYFSTYDVSTGYNNE